MLNISSFPKLNTSDVSCLNVSMWPPETRMCCNMQEGERSDGQIVVLLFINYSTNLQRRKKERKGRHNDSQSVTKPTDHREETTLCFSYLTLNTHTHTHHSNVSVRRCDKKYFTVCLKMNGHKQPELNQDKLAFYKRTCAV